MKTTDEKKVNPLAILPLRRPAGTLMLSLALVLGGIWSLFTIDLDFLPEISVPKLSVIAPYQGLPAGEIRELITLPLEESLSSLSGLKGMESLSRDGLALLELTFPWGTDRVVTGLRTREVIDTAYLTLPGEAEKPRVLPVDPGALPVLVLGVYPKSGDLSLARRLSDREIKTRLQQIEGVGSVQVSGGLEEEIHIEADPSLLTAQGQTLPTLAEGLARTNMDYPVGHIIEGPLEYIVKVKARARSLQDLEELYLPDPTARIKDLASVSLGTKEQKSFFLGWTSGNQDSAREGVRILIRRQDGFSPRLMAEEVRSELTYIRKSYNRDLEIQILLDRSAVLNRSFKDLAVSLGLGGVIAFIVLFLFIRSLPTALIVLVSLPASLLWALLFLRLAGIGLNLMSLGGLALGVGMVVDNAIVVTERLSRKPGRGIPREERIAATASAVSRLAPSLTGSTVTTVVVFTPLLFLSGITGALFRDMALAVIFALLSSLLISMTVIPVLCLLLKNPLERKKRESLLFPLLRKQLRKNLRRPVRALLLLTITGIAGFMILPLLPAEILPPLHEGKLGFRIHMPPGTGLETMKTLGHEVVKGLRQVEYIQEIQLWAGGESGDPYYLASTDEAAEILQGRVFFSLHTSLDTAGADIQKALPVHSGSVTVLPPENILESLLGIESGSDWALSGNDPERVRQEAGTLLTALSAASASPTGIPDLVPSEGRTILRLYPDRQEIAALGLDLSNLTDQIGQAFSGSVSTRILVDGREVDVRLRAREEDRRMRGDILNLEIPCSGTERVKLYTVMRLEEEQSAPYLCRKNRKDLGILRFQGGPSSGQIEILRQAGAEPVASSSLKDQRGEIMMLFTTALLLLYLALGLQFESFLLPFLLMLSIPLGVGGISLALLVNRVSINLNSSLGLLVLMGLSVNNGILLYEEYTHRRSLPGSTGPGALYRGISDRLRPVFMTSLTTIFALLPLAIDPRGTSSQCSLATAVIGGLSASTLLSLLLLPHLLLAGEKKK